MTTRLQRLCVCLSLTVLPHVAGIATLPSGFSTPIIVAVAPTDSGLGASDPETEPVAPAPPDPSPAGEALAAPVVENRARPVTLDPETPEALPVPAAELHVVLAGFTAPSLAHRLEVAPSNIAFHSLPIGVVAARPPPRPPVTPAVPVPDAVPTGVLLLSGLGLLALCHRRRRAR